MTLAAPTVGRMGETIPLGRLYLAADPTFLRLRDRAGGYDVQFVLMPYPTASRYIKGEGGLKYGSPEEKNNLLIAAWADTLRDIRAHPSYDPKAPAVLGAHVHLHGSSVGPSLFRITNEEDIVVQGAELPNQFDYIALGHIHKPQFLGASHVRYSGSIERMDLGEQGDRKGVVLVEIGEDGRNEEPVVLEMPSTPIYEVSVLDPATDIPRLMQEYPGAANDLVNLHIKYTAGSDQLEEVLRDLDRIFPRWYARDWQESGTLGQPIGGSENVSKSFADTVRDYLGQELIQHDENERAEILSIVDELLKDEEGE
jgi:exonuclease SbcD